MKCYTSSKSKSRDGNWDHPQPICPAPPRYHFQLGLCGSYRRGTRALNPMTNPDPHYSSGYAGWPAGHIFKASPIM